MNTSARRRLELVAVLVISAGLIGCAPPPDIVANPDYQAWVHFPPGTNVRFEGIQTIGEDSRPIIITEKLMSKDADRIILERVIERQDNGSEAQTSLWVERAEVAAMHHPLTHPKAIIRPQEAETIDVGDRPFACEVVELKLKAPIQGFFEASEDVEGRLWQHADVPGRVVKVDLQAVAETYEYRLQGQVVSFEVAR